jgi:hypothetical protein
MKFLTRFIFVCTALLFAILLISIFGIFVNRDDTFAGIVPGFMGIFAGMAILVFSLLGIVIASINERKGVNIYLENTDSKYKYSSFYRNLIILILCIPLFGIFVGMLGDWFRMLPIWLK